MARTLVDIDDEALAGAREVLGTGTIKDTVNRALADAAARRSRGELLDWLHSDPLPDARDPEVLAAAWR